MDVNHRATCVRINWHFCSINNLTINTVLDSVRNNSLTVYSYCLLKDHQAIILLPMEGTDTRLAYR
jgi:hypothetical protein